MTLARFLRNGSGAVTVDWVVLSAISIGFGLMILLTLSGGASDLAGEIAIALADVEISGGQLAAAVPEASAAVQAPPP